LSQLAGNRKGSFSTFNTFILLCAAGGLLHINVPIPCAHHFLH